MNATDVMASGLGAPGVEISLWSHVLGRPLRRQVRDARPARRLGLVLGHHHRQDAALFRAPASRWTASRRCSGPASRWKSSTARSPTGRPAAWPPCSSRPCASGSAPSRAPAAPSLGLAQRIDKVLDVTIQREVERLESKLLVLATIGSSAPFIGLFGTVWGIMTSFRSIAASKNTSLAVVAPGIAEALFATAIGLFAAIPAVIAYNKLQAEAAKQQARLEGFADEFSAILSRQIDERIAA